MKNNIKHQHPFHIVDRSPWPLSGAIGALTTTTGLVSWFQGDNIYTALFGVTLLSLIMILWWRDVVREATFLGMHTTYVVRGIKIGFILFILSEIMFFFSFFWAFFHSALSPTPEIGMTWPPTGINPINPWGVPLLNTAILLSSGASLTWSHHSLRNSNGNEAWNSLTTTILLGIWFTALQAYEYWEASFTIADSIYGSTFFVATGFHGLHVIIGTTFLSVCLIRLTRSHFSINHHVGFECAIWYWHFVDVVWIFLFICIYWWGGN
uniref:Cytochrome c oxidase subunit 3 n=1 Tax=Ophiarachnella gorgonia TaxID=1365872 RepID=A0A6C0FES5_9ECHI|nr:cytochrome c oxidase subunit III [Ophiarachnella gorgonia]QHT54252.1 cytochrome oxidase subunit 3 [Ophiarachnella gorgonia]